MPHGVALVYWVTECLSNALSAWTSLVHNMGWPTLSSKKVGTIMSCPLEEYHGVLSTSGGVEGMPRDSIGTHVLSVCMSVYHWIHNGWHDLVDTYLSIFPLVFLVDLACLAVDKRSMDKLPSLVVLTRPVPEVTLVSNCFEEEVDR